MIFKRCLWNNMCTGSKIYWDLCHLLDIKCCVFICFSSKSIQLLAKWSLPRLHLQLWQDTELNMRLIQVYTSLPQLRGSESELAGQQGVLHAVLFADVKDSVSMLQEDGRLKAWEVIGVWDLSREGAVCCSTLYFWVLLLFSFFSREGLTLRSNRP